MPYHQSDCDSGETLYCDSVRRRLIRVHQGVSLFGCVGVVIVLTLAALMVALPAADHFDGGLHGDGIYFPMTPAP